MRSAVRVLASAARVESLSSASAVERWRRPLSRASVVLEMHLVSHVYA
jgi:hypothetical protein